MNSKIEKHFHHSQFYRNYNNIEQIILKIQKIKNEYTESKNKYKNKSISIINSLHKNRLQNKFLEKLISILYHKFGFFNFEKEFDKLFNINDIDENILNSCKKILNEKIILSHNIKKYVKYSEDIDNEFYNSIEIGCIKNINHFIKNGADIHSYDDYALRLSVENEHIDVVKFFVKKGCNIHTEEELALLISCEKKNIEIFKFLVEKGADIHTHNDLPLQWSSQCGNIEIVKFLIENGANIHADNDAALKRSLIRGHTKVARFLIENNANIHADDDYVLRMSSEKGYVDLVKFLIQNGADIHAKDDYALKKSSQCAWNDGDVDINWFSEKEDYIEIVKILIQSDIEYYINMDLARNIVIEHKLIEFYEKFNIK